METKHTSGNWAVSKTINDHIIYAEDNKGGKDIALIYEYSRGIDKEEAEANAQLITASPDLLEALHSVLWSSNNDGTILTPEAKEIVINAIRKAQL